jgi:hypothetical protein
MPPARGTLKATTEQASPRVFHAVDLSAPSDREKITEVYSQKNHAAEATKAVTPKLFVALAVIWELLIAWMNEAETT